MAVVTVTLDAHLAIDVMLMSGTSNPQDAVELIVRDYLLRGGSGRRPSPGKRARRTGSGTPSRGRRRADGPVG